jgi:hypothetical protein
LRCGYPAEERWNDQWFCSNTWGEIKAAVTAVRRNRNDLSVANAIGWMTYVNAHIDVEKGGVPLQDIAVFLPHAAEYYESKETNSLNIRADTARLVCKYYSMLSNRMKAVIEPHIAEIRRTADQ